MTLEAFFQYADQQTDELPLYLFDKVCGRLQYLKPHHHQPKQVHNAVLSTKQ